MSKRALEKSRRELESTRRELRVIKGTLGSIGSLRSNPGVAHVPQVGPSTYSGAVKSGRVPQHTSSSFVTTFAAALETALTTAGLRLAPYAC